MCRLGRSTCFYQHPLSTVSTMGPLHLRERLRAAQTTLDTTSRSLLTSVDLIFGLLLAVLLVAAVAAAAALHTARTAPAPS